MSKKKRINQIMAWLALFWIVIWIIWTWVLVFFGWNNSSQQTLTQEEYLQLQEYLNSQSWAIETSTWETITLTWETN